jgi:hypothetical protein
MARLARFIAVLVIGLALLTWGALRVVYDTTRAWFERDMNLRAQLAVNGARASPASRPPDQSKEVQFNGERALTLT